MVRARTIVYGLWQFLNAIIIHLIIRRVLCMKYFMFNLHIISTCKKFTAVPGRAVITFCII